MFTYLALVKRFRILTYINVDTFLLRRDTMNMKKANLKLFKMKVEISLLIFPNLYYI